MREDDVLPFAAKIRPDGVWCERVDVSDTIMQAALQAQEEEYWDEQYLLEYQSIRRNFS